MMEDKVFGESGSRVVIEEFLTGPEVSVLSFTDGKTLIPMVSSMDHKRALDGDKDSIPAAWARWPRIRITLKKLPPLRRRNLQTDYGGHEQRGKVLLGCLYFGLMITEDGPKVIEYNCRFGDPETQVVLPLLDSDLFDIFLHVSEGTLDRAEVNFSDDAACCVVMASSGYPVKYEKGFAIEIPEDVEDVYIAGAKLSEDGRLLTNGGRVLGVTERGKDIREAIEKAYRSVERISFDNAFYRKDIGKRALAALEK